MRINGKSKEIPLEDLKRYSSIDNKELEKGIKQLSHGLLFTFNMGKKLFSFSHETLQEYLIAKK